MLIITLFCPSTVKDLQFQHLSMSVEKSVISEKWLCLKAIYVGEFLDQIQFIPVFLSFVPGGSYECSIIVFLTPNLWGFWGWGVGVVLILVFDSIMSCNWGGGGLKIL